ncbi:MAG: choice-of-anchor D domain-containing protein [Nitrospirae bacterium]|nr:choice-of-anchor D domain-containing protein [Nitrospirota bacterium]
MKKIWICAVLLLPLLTGTGYCEEAGCLQTKNNWIIRVVSEGVANPFGFVLEVTDPLTGALVTHDKIKAFSGAAPPFHCLNPDSSTTNLCLIEANAQHTDVSLACDAAAGTAYVFHDSGGQPFLNTIKDITLVSVGTPILTPSATLLNFGTITVNTTANAALTARNTGTANLTITSVTSPAAPFTKISDTCTGATLIPNGTCAITVRFAPTNAIVYNGSFNILSNGGNATISLTGTGKASGGGIGMGF